MFDMKALTPEQIAMLKRFMEQSVSCLHDIHVMYDAIEDTARAVADELGMGSEGANILLNAAEKAFENIMEPPEMRPHTVEDILEVCSDAKLI